jgi:hypothetical protein
MMKFSKIAIATVAALTLAACGDDDDDSTTSITPETEVVVDTETVAEDEDSVEYEVKLINLTSGQPISPPALLLHDDGELWSVGTSASDALELVAESGDSSEVVASEFVLSHASAEGGIVYGTSTTVTVTHTEAVNYLSFASMLGNTNDAFTGLNKVDISELAINDSVTYNTIAYDAGTEANTETAETVPGPAGNGEAFNSERDDVVDVVTMHPGLVTSDDGLSTSTLTYQQKFDNPVMSVVIKRIQ